MLILLKSTTNIHCRSGYPTNQSIDWPQDPSTAIPHGERVVETENCSICLLTFVLDYVTANLNLHPPYITIM